MVQTDEFFEEILQATPYNYLDVLKIGSRPSKRQTGGRRLRAIPWVLCWTQSRVLFPTWWGVGSAYAELWSKEREELRYIFQKNELFRSFIKSFGFTLRKIELPLWRLYLERLDLPKKRIDEIFTMFKQEYDKCVTMFEEVTGEKNLLWHRPWLGQSIYFRSSMIHPLNIIQLEALRRKDEVLLRETVTGVACGMMTTG
jgi:phosphoenolpyruvate carboxylase